MKNRFLLPVFFILLCAVLTAVLSGIGLATFLVSYPDAIQIPGLGFQYVLQQLSSSFLAAVVISWLWAWSKIRQRGSGFFSHGIVLFVLSTAVLGLGSYGIGILQAQGSNISREGNDLTIGHGLSAGTLHRNPDMVIRVHQSEPLFLNRVYSRSFLPLQNGRFDERVVYSSGTEELFFPLTEDGSSGNSDQFGIGRALDTLGGRIRPVDVSAFHTTLRGSLEKDPFLDFVIRSVSRLSSVLVHYGSDFSVRLFVMAGALSLFFAGAGVFQRGGVWPLLGPLSGLGISISGIVLFQFLLSGEIREAAELFLQPRALGYLGPGIIGGLGLIMAAMGGLFGPKTVKPPKNPKGKERKKVRKHKSPRPSKKTKSQTPNPEPQELDYEE